MPSRSSPKPTGPAVAASAAGREVVAEFEKTLDNELDLMREAANAAQLRRNFADSDKLYVPDVYWDYCRPTC